MNAARSLVLAGLALAALLGVVALASRGGVAGETSTGRGFDVPPVVVGTVYAVLVVAVAIMLPFFFYAAARDQPLTRRQKLRLRFAPLLVVAGAAVLMVFALRHDEALSEILRALRIRDAGGGAGAAGEAAQAPPVAWLPLVLVLAAVAVGAGAVVGRRALRRRRASHDASLEEELAAVLGETLDDLRAEQDPRRAIILAYAQLERVLEARGVPRDPADAPHEYLARVLVELDVAREPALALTELFERAKFSQHSLDGATKEDAIAALEAVRAELGARA